MTAINGISVIICTFNGCNRIIPTLNALANQSLCSNINYEILLIDNASTDETTEIVNEYWSKINSLIPLRIISEPRQGKANALTTGYNEARYELMLLCDDDNWLHPDYLKTVIDIFSKNPEIALAGGYGIAEFGKEEKPLWFDKWQHNFVCGKHHINNGFLKFGDVSIWGAGSILRKSIWEYLTDNGFCFVNSKKAGKALGEDTELSYAVMFSGNKLYFDERLWFIHDLSGNRVNWQNFIKQMKENGRVSACFTIFNVAYKLNAPLSLLYYIYFYRFLAQHCLGFIFQCLKRDNKPMIISRYEFLKVLFSNRKSNYALFLSSYKWISRIRK